MKLLTLLPALFLCSLAQAGEVPFPQCPVSLRVTQTAQADAVDTWKTVNNDSSHWLAHIGISTGEYPVKQTGLDRADNEEKHRGYGVAHYSTPPFERGGHDYWVVCDYSQSAVVLVKKLPENVVRCEVKYLNNYTAIEDSVTIKCFDTPRKTRR